jgi:hypothetical protein
MTVFLGPVIKDHYTVRIEFKVLKI